ncbi:MAG: hypothetical protein HQL54_06500 [Magnetococcales bacterium]|nr:hypothetical protein [Magnetococcales bacterium]
MFLITGYGRSGTHYTSRILQALGVDAPHETEGKDGVTSWKHIVPGTFVVIGKNREQIIPDISYDTVIHQVRNPLKVLTSAQTFSESSLCYMEQKLGIDTDSDPKGNALFTLFGHKKRNHRIRRCMRTWLGWTKRIEQRADWRYRIEDFQEIFPELLSKLGLPVQNLPVLQKEARDSRVGRKGYTQLTWDKLKEADKTLAENVEKRALEFGYDIN